MKLNKIKVAKELLAIADMLNDAEVRVAAKSYKEYLKGLKNKNKSKFKNEQEYNKAMGVEKSKGKKKDKPKSEKKDVSKDIAEQVKKKVESKGFSEESDSLFDSMVGDAGKNRDKYDSVLKVVNTAPTKGNLAKLKGELKNVNSSPAKSALSFIKKMEDGNFKSEFKKFDGKHSQVSELFSFLKQSITYND